jgi:hypothetical protein
MRTSEECHQHADFCERQAAIAADAQNRTFFLEAANEWRKLAGDRGDLRSQLFMMTKRS